MKKSSADAKNAVSKRKRDGKDGTKKDTAKETVKEKVEVKARRGKALHIPTRYWYVGLLAIILFSFYLHAIMPMKGVFIGDAVRFSSESDAWYHMMLAKSTVINHHRTFFDPLTNFPFGTSIHFGPFVSWGIAITSFIAGLGSPSMHTVEVVGAFWPAVLGTLLALPVFFIGKEIGGRGCGILAALLVVILPGQLFSRTTLGFTDHHSSEILLSSLTMLFFLMAMRVGRKLTFSRLAKGGLKDQREPLLYAVLAGVSLGLYLDAWSMGVLFEGILLIFMFLQGSVDHIRKRSVDYLGVIWAIAFAIALVMMLPFANPANGFSVIQYSFFQPAMLLVGIVFALLFSAVSRLMAQKGVDRYLFLPAIVGIILLGFLILYLAVPAFAGTFLWSLGTYMLPRTGGAATVAELSTILSNEGIQGNFPGIIGILSPFFLAIVGLVLILARYVKEERPGDLLVVIWSLVILMITLVSNRSAYYFGVNVALLCSYLALRALEYTKFGELEDAIMRKAKDPLKILKEDLKVPQLAVALLIIVILIFPSMSVSVQMAKYASGPNPDWYSSIAWMTENTTDPGMDIYEIYERPPAGEKYPYPDSAYGVMSWWDYGHLIETIGHRSPNANPFQEGIGNITADVPGSSPFFLAESEDEAERVLARLDLNRTPYRNTRFVMTDIEMAVGKFYAMTAWSSVPITRYYGFFYQPQGDQLVPIRAYRDPYFNTMVTRLHFFDGTQTPIGDSFGIAYRTAEQDGNRYSVIVDAPLVSSDYQELQKFVNDSKAEGYSAEVVSTADVRSLTPSLPLEALKHYRLVHESERSVTYDGQKYVKTFEHVPGAVLKGRAPAGTAVSVAVPVLTNQNRLFTYTQSNVTGPDGQYTLIVPYSTEGPIEGGTNFDTAPIAPYRLIVGGQSYEVRVPEQAVLRGEVMALNA